MSGDVQSCFVCGHDPEKTTSDDEDWLVLGIIDDKVHADLARETLKSCNIPAVVISKSGFFGNIGLSLNPFYTNSSAAFEVSVPQNFADEAANVLESTVGEKWHRQG
jgi:hypothetical protein